MRTAQTLRTFRRVALLSPGFRPFFRGNWLAKRGEARRPALFNQWNAGTLALSGTALAGWAARPDAGVAGAASLSPAVPASMSGPWAASAASAG